MHCRKSTSLDIYWYPELSLCYMNSGCVLGSRYQPSSHAPNILYICPYFFWQANNHPGFASTRILFADIVAPSFIFLFYSTPVK